MRRITFAFALMICSSPARLYAQRATGDTIASVGGPTSDRKSPLAARLIGVVPGAGHIYAGETGRGLGYLGGIVATAAIVSTVLVADCLDKVLSYDQTSDDCGSSVANVGAGALLGLWGWSIYDAGRAAGRTNRKRGLDPSIVVAPTTSSAGRGRDARALKLGVAFDFR